ncbi:Eco57I restriction-modification methylase domain-containing protein [Coralliovum pocilloporae]|uniref:Eco57I restriction-modification methylase domain-containing protein n=1 Tax=Coralliovum pocilloporae TaxID=3066369 RepID=UPI00330701CF
MAQATLFNPKTLKKYTERFEACPDHHREILENWAELIRSARIKDYKETALHGEFKTRLVETVLGYRGPVEGQDFTVAAEKAILRGSVDLALGHFSTDRAEIIAPFELKGAKTKDLDAIMPGRAKSPVQQAWEYATNAPGVKWVLVSNYLEIRLYGFGEGTQAYERFDLAKLTEPEQYARFMLLLSAENLLTGRTAELLAESRREDKDITNRLYSHYKILRSELIAAVRAAAPTMDPLKSISVAQTILDRVLFTAFAEDTGLLPDRILERAFEHSDPFNPKPIWDNFKGLFASIDKGNKALDVPPYNGGLFAPDPDIDAIHLPDEVCEGFKRIGDYDFGSEVSVTVLGHIFEQSISDVEREQAIARGDAVEVEKTSGTSGRRKRDGVVYTPDYIARFIVEQTLGTHLKEIFTDILKGHAKKNADLSDYETIPWKRKSAEFEAWEAYRNRLKTLRIVDPACGSGVFLVMAFDFMKAELTRVNDKIASLKGTGLYGDLLDPDSDILTNNLYGVDVNEESVEIAKLSLWVKTARKGKALDSLDNNLKVGDSLIEDSNYAYLAHGFTWATAFPHVFAEGGFDVVLGNPPYVRQELLGDMKPYLEKRFDVYHGVADLYCYFFERGLRLLKPGGRLGYISSATFFKTASGQPLRDFLRNKATLETIVDFGDLQIFEGVTTYPAILTMRAEKPGKEHQTRFWNVDKRPNDNFSAAYGQAAEHYAQQHLSTESWELESPALKALRDKIRAGRKTLKEVYGSPLYGIKTGRNEAFVIDRQTRDRLIAEDPKSEEILKPWLEGRDLKRWRAESRDLWLIFTRRGVDIDAYPAIKQHLERYREILEPKPVGWRANVYGEKWPGRKPGPYYWYEVQDTIAYYTKLDAPKIYYKDIADHAPFHIDIEGSYSANTGYFIPQEDWSLLAFLNSKICWFTYLSMSAQIRGGFVRFFSQFVEQLPVPQLSEPPKSELASLARACQTAAEERYRLQQGLRRRIPDLCPDGREPKLNNKLKEWWALPDFAAFQAEVKKSFKADIPLSERNDWEDWINRDRADINRLTAEIAAHEDRINAIVYELFELTPDEITLLEANL